jgi:hypothetical protein
MVRESGYCNVSLRYLGRKDSNGTFLVRGPYSLCVAATLSLSRSNGRTEKNLCRQGSQRNAGTRSTRPISDAIPGTYSAEMRCNSKFPQIPQCA